ncbi:MAG: (2Fe-2S)-binding protein [Gammaproteobacteria bacterium]|nr:(2Fe-2S)-binding protein [Gammaproteobacteria bacterium]
MKRHIIRLTVNGDTHELAVAPNATLVEVIRDRLGLTGTKRGCTSGACGVCTINDEEGRALLSCLTLAVAWDGCSLTTIEGVAEGGRLHPLQQAFWELGAVQCGYCTPGLVMTARALLLGNPQADAPAIDEALAGTLCRCTGHIKVKQAVASAVARVAADHVAATPESGNDGAQG